MWEVFECGLLEFDLQVFFPSFPAKSGFCDLWRVVTRKSWQFVAFCPRFSVIFAEMTRSGKVCRACSWCVSRPCLNRALSYAAHERERIRELCNHRFFVPGFCYAGFSSCFWKREEFENASVVVVAFSGEGVISPSSLAG